MTAKKPKTDFTRLAEIMHVQLRQDYIQEMDGSTRRRLYYVCDLCLEETPAGLEIARQEHCPIERMKK